MFRLSEAEKERRWKLVRGVMAQRGLDYLIVHGSFGMHGNLNANLRYLTNPANEGYVLFPLDGEPALFTFLKKDDPGSWVKDTRSGHPTYSQAILDRLKESHFQSGKIGIVGISGMYGERDFPYATYMKLASSLPKVKLEDATDILEEARMIKSPEEIKCLEIGCEVGEKAIQAIAAMARVGTTSVELRLKVTETLLLSGCEPFFMFLYASGKSLFTASQHGFFPSEGGLQKGDMFLVEFDAKYNGYLAQFNQPFSLGKPTKEWQEITDVTVASFDSGFKALKPGVTVGELHEAFVAPIKQAGYTQGYLNIHGLGMEVSEPFDAFPYMPYYKPNNSFKMKAGMVLEFEPQVETVNPPKKGLQIGCPVLVTETGCRLLTKTWKPELIIT
ncbi:MAG: aminopeptidase P family protein [Chloroflexi bacterium]|nr:aminopeptidase P family protein [Chloroflexota bacterium]